MTRIGGTRTRGQGNPAGARTYAAHTRHSGKPADSCERVGSHGGTGSAFNNSPPQIRRGCRRSAALLAALPREDAFRMPFLRQEEAHRREMKKNLDST